MSVNVIRTNFEIAEQRKRSIVNETGWFNNSTRNTSPLNDSNSDAANASGNLSKSTINMSQRTVVITKRDANNIVRIAEEFKKLGKTKI